MNEFFLCNLREKLDKMGVCVRIFGDQSLLPNDLQKIIAKIMHITKHNKK
jgi:undecaprenyl diphosphate synthase